MEKYKIPLMYKRIGGRVSRSVELEVASGLITIREIKLGTGVADPYQYQFRK